MVHKDVGVFLCADIPFAKVGVVFPHGAEDKYLLPDFMKVREYLTAFRALLDAAKEVDAVLSMFGGQTLDLQVLEIIVARDVDLHHWWLEHC